MNKNNELIQIEKKVRKLMIWIFVNFFLIIIGLFLIIIKIKPYEVSEATFIGTMITTMGVLFTVIASYQIYNIIELNHRFKQVDKTEEKMNDMLVQFENKVGNMDDVIHIIYGHGLVTRALSAMNKDKKEDAVLLMMEGIVEYLDVRNVGDVISELHKVLFNLQKITSNITQVSNKWKEDACMITTKIQSHRNYALISNQFDKIKVLWE